MIYLTINSKHLIGSGENASKIVSAAFFILILFGAGSAVAEDWVLVQPGYEINLYSDRDYYHLDFLNCLEYWRMKTVFSDGSSVIQRYEVNWKTHEIKKI